MIARLFAGATLILTTSGSPAAAPDASAPAAAAGPGQGASVQNRSATGAPVSAPPTRADSGGGEPEGVELTVVGAELPYQSLRDRIGAHAPRGAPLSWNRIDRFNPLAELLRGDARPHSRSLRCWVDLSDLRRATLYFAAPGGERFLVRDVALSGRLDEIDQQSLAQVLELSIAALLEDADIGLSRAQAREMLSRSAATAATTTAAATTNPPPAAAAESWHIVVGAFYAIEAIAAGLPAAQGPGLDLALRASHDDGTTAAAPLGLWIAGQYQLPASTRLQDIGVRLQTAAARAGVQASWWHLRARLGAGADWVYVTPLPGTGSASATPAAAHWSRSLVVNGALAAHIPLGGAPSGGRRRLGVTVAAFVDVVPETTRYQVQGTDAVPSRFAFTLRRVRPGLALGLAF